MRKIKMLLLIIIFTLSVNSQVLADENISEFNKYDVYSSESQSEKEVYDLIYNAFMDLSKEIDLSKYSMTSDQVFAIRNKVMYDHPEIFYLDYEKSSYWTNGRLEFGYIDTDENIIEKRNQLTSKIENILSELIEPDMTEFQKEIAIHDYIVLNTRYDEENYNNNTIPRESYTTYGTLINGLAVCQGYSETFKLLLREVGIESIIVSSPEMNHAWNIVNIDGENYQVDVTWNDPTPDREGKTRYKYFNLTDSQMSKDHTWNYSNYPESTSDKYSYLWEVDSPLTDGSYKYYSSSQDNLIYRLDESANKEKITSQRAPYFAIAGEYIYFSNYSNGGYLYRIKKDGKGLALKLNDKHSVDIYLEDNYIYYIDKESGIKENIKVDIKDSEVKAESVSLDKTVLELIEGQSEKITEKVYPSSTTNKGVFWSSTNPSVAVVEVINNQSYVRALSAGKAKIIVKTKDGSKSASCLVNVGEESYNTPLDKIWTIKFNKSVDRDSINPESIFILNEYGNKVDIDYKVDGREVKLLPKSNYIKNKEYIIYITEKVKSNNKNLLVPVEKKFNTYIVK